MFTPIQTLMICLFSTLIVFGIFTIANGGAIPPLRGAEATMQTPELPRGIDVRCIDGYKFVNKHGANIIQLLNSAGGAVECK